MTNGRPLATGNCILRTANCKPTKEGASEITEEKKYTAQEWHKKSAIDLFNRVWSLLDKEDRSQQEDAQMVHAAHASRYHWGEIGTPVEVERGEWQISRVYSVLDRPHAALYHARRCLEICRENEIGDFDIAFAYEAMARAFAVAGHQAECQRHVALAKEAGERIEAKDDRNYFFSELDAVVGC